MTIAAQAYPRPSAGPPPPHPLLLGSPPAEGWLPEGALQCPDLFSGSILASIKLGAAVQAITSWPEQTLAPCNSSGESRAAV